MTAPGVLFHGNGAEENGLRKRASFRLVLTIWLVALADAPAPPWPAPPPGRLSQRESPLFVFGARSRPGARSRTRSGARSRTRAREGRARPLDRRQRSAHLLRCRGQTARPGGTQPSGDCLFHATGWIWPPYQLVISLIIISFIVPCQYCYYLSSSWFLNRATLPSLVCFPKFYQVFYLCLISSILGSYWLICLPIYMFSPFQKKRSTTPLKSSLTCHHRPQFFSIPVDGIDLLWRD